MVQAQKRIGDVLFLTACVNPNGMAFTELCDPEVRRSQYMSALSWYLKNTSFKILLVENSGCDFSSEYENFIKAGRLEFLTYNGNDYDRSKGKGYGEALIIDYGIRHSKLLNASPSGTLVIKVTGRLICKNINSLYMRCSKQNTVYANFSKDDWNEDVAHSRVVMAPISFFERFFLPEKEKINDTLLHFFEHVLYDSITKWKKEGGRHREFWYPPIMGGVSGTLGVKIDDVVDFTSILKYRFVYVLHRFFGYRGYANPFYHGRPKPPVEE